MNTERPISHEVLELHNRILYPSVRVRAKSAMGSGTLIFCQPEDPENHPDEFETLVLTNHHVISDLIEVKEDWDSTAGRKRFREFREPAIVEFFEYKHYSRVTSKNGKEAEIVAWDDKVDLALLRLGAIAEFGPIASLASHEQMERGLYAFDAVYCVGCALGEDPVITHGQLSGFDRKIESHPYLMHTAPSIFGNSGGALYLEETRELIGVPARIAVSGYSQAITHLSYAIPATTIFKFLDDKDFQYVYDPAFTSAQCKKVRDAKQAATAAYYRRPLDPNDPEAATADADGDGDVPGPFGNTSNNEGDA
jgi:S1-C subfamily serine protease